MTLTTAPVVAMLPVVDMARAKKFYGEQLGLVEDTSMNIPGTAMYKAGAGTMLGLYEREATKADHTAACFTVNNIVETISDLKSKGVTFEEYNDPGFTTVDSIVSVDGMKSAWFKDTEGNILALNQKG